MKGVKKAGVVLRVFLTLLAVVLLVPLNAVPARAALALTVGPVDPLTIFQGDPNTGYPGYYGDDVGTKLSLLPITGDGLNAPTQIYFPKNPAIPYSNFLGFDAEAFYYNATAKFTTANNGKGLALFGLEAGFANLITTPHQEVVFSRVRFTIDVPVAGTYVIDHPYGSDTVVVTAADITSGKGLRFTSDVGITARNFNLATTGHISHFMHQTVPLPPAGWIGDGASIGPVTDAPVNNFVKVTGPLGVNLDGAGHNFVQTDQFMISGRILPGLAPVASFNKTVAPVTDVVPATVTMTDTSSGAPSGWLWDFGDGTTSALKNPVKTYTAAGNYNITLTVTNGAGVSSTSQSISIYSLPVVSFTHSAVNGLPPVSLNFKDTTSGNPTSWSWNFGDGTTSTLQNPGKIYAAAGTYTVRLTATNVAGTASTSQTFSISPSLIAAFSESQSSGNAPLAVSFVNSSVGSITGWSWTFGDGTGSALQNPPLKTYAAAGNYVVTLTVSDAAGSASMSRTINVYSPPAASFSKSPAGGIPPLTVKFTDTSSGNPNNWLWVFGDGTSSTLKSPTKTYAAAGNYNVTLTAANPAGSSTAAQTVSVSVAFLTLTPPDLQVGPVDPAFIFNGDPNTSFPGYYMDSQGTKLALLPVVGAPPPAVVTPTQVFTAPEAGTQYAPYSQFLGFGAEAFYYDAVAKFNTSAGKGLALFGIEAGFINLFHPVPGDEVVFARTRFRIDVPVAGLYTVQYPYGTQTFNVTQDDITKKKGLNFTSDISLAPRDFGAATVGPFSNFLHQTNPPAGWIGDGATIGPVTGSPTGFNAVLITGPVGVDLDGLGHNFILADQFMVSGRILTAVAPAASFTKTLLPLNGAAPLMVNLTDSSTGTPTGWLWNFGDGNTSTLRNPVKTYNTPGNYIITLTATNAAGVSSTSQTVGVYGTPVAGFSKSADKGAAPLLVDFTDSSTGNITAWVWDFGDGTTSTLPNPNKVYTVGGTFTVTLTVTNPAGTAATSQTIIVGTKPAAPTGLSAAIANGTQIDLAWTDNSNNEDSFRVERSLNNLVYSPIGSVLANVAAYSDSTVAAGNSYYYRVIAVNVLGDSPPSNVVKVDVLVPAAPSALTAAVFSATQFDLAWTDNSATETGFNIERSTDNITFTPLASLPANKTTYSDLTISAGNTYYYRVLAVNLVGPSAPSNIAQLATLVPVAPIALTGLQATSTQVNLSWTDNSTDETGFRVERCTDNINFVPAGSVTVNVSAFNDLTVVSGTSYYYRVIAVNVFGDSAPSNVVFMDGGVPAVPSGLAAALPNASQVDLSWVDNSDNETGFNIERSLDGLVFNFAGNVGVNVTAFSDTTVTSGNSYFYRVIAVNAGGSSVPSNVTQIIVDSPLAPSGLSAVMVSGTRIDLSWVDNSNNENGFSIERSTDGVTFTAIGNSPANTVAFSDTALVANSTLSYRVKAVNAVGASAPSNAVQFNIAVPAAPANLAAAVITLNQVDLSWVDNANNETGFRVERSADGIAYTSLGSVGANVTNFSDTTVTLNAVAFYRVFAFGIIGDSAASNVVQVNAPVPAAPTSLQAVLVSASRIDLTWVDNSNNETGFSIERSVNGGAFAALGGTLANVSGFSDITAAVNNSYSYLVSAASAFGPSAPSNVVALSLAIPAVASGLTATAVSDLQINLSWADNSNNETGFRVERASAASFIGLANLGTLPANATSFIDTSVTVAPSTTYFYRVIAVNIVGDALASNTATVTTPPARPNALAAPLVQANRVNLTWIDNATNETGFRIQRAANNLFTLGLLETTLAVNNTTFTDNTVGAGLTYFYRVVAFNANGSSGPSNVITVATTPPTTIPAAPSTLTSTGATGPVVNLSWRDNSNNEATFRIRRSPDGVTFIEIGFVAANAISYQDATVAAGSTYFYQVTAQNVVGTSGPSNTAQASITLPLAPSGLTATVFSSTQIDLRFVDNASNETGFRLVRASDSAFTLGLVNFNRGASAGTGATLVVSDTTAVLNNTYYYRVFAVNTNGDSPASVAVQVTISGPLAPTGLAATIISPVQVNLNWTDTANNETAVIVQRATNNTFSLNLKTFQSLPANSISAIDSTVVAGSTYFYRVIFQNLVGQSLPSNVVTVSLSNPVAPSAAPSGLAAARVQAGRIDLTWIDNSNNETGFLLQRATDGTFTQNLFVANLGVNKTTFTDNGASAGITFFYRVFAVNPAGNSLSSNVISATPPAATGTPVAPGAVTAQILVGSTEVELVWEDLSDNEAGFRVERADDPGFSVRLVQFPAVGPSANKFKDITATLDQTYYYRIIAFNSLGETVSAPFVVNAGKPAAAPASVTAAQASDTQIDLTWVDNTNNETGWKVERSTTADFAVKDTFAVPNPAFSIGQAAALPSPVITYSDMTAVTPNTYFYRVRTTNQLGDSAAASSTASVTLAAQNLPLAPTGLTAVSADSDLASLTWVDNSINEQGFQVSRALDAQFSLESAKIADLPAGTSSFDDHLVVPGVTYFYKVEAFNALGKTTSNVVSVSVIPATVIPATPSGLVATAVSSQRVNLTWIENSNNESGFRVERSTDSQFVAMKVVATLGVEVFSYSDTSAEAQVRYYYRVIAFNNIGDSAPSNVVEVNTPEILPPADPGILPGSGSGSGGSGKNETPVAVETKGLSGDSVLKVDSSGKTQDKVKLSSSGTTGGSHSIDIAAGTVMKAKDGTALKSITMEKPVVIPPASAQNTLVQTQDLGPNGSTFDPPITVTLSFDPASLPAGTTAADLTMGFWNGSQWEVLDAKLDAANHTLSVQVKHFTIFGILAKAPAATAVPTSSVTPTEPKPSVTPLPAVTSTPPATTSPAPTTVPVPASSVAPDASSKTPSAPGNNMLMIGVIILAAFLIGAVVLIARRAKSK